MLFVYTKHDASGVCRLIFEHCAFIDKERTADYTTTARLAEMLKDGATKADIIAYFYDRNLPGDEIVYNQLADEIMTIPFKQGYLTISNALQWRLQYSRIINLNNIVDGIVNYVHQA